MGRSQKYLYGIRVEVDDSLTVLPFDTSVIKPFCHKAADVKEYDSLRSDFPNKLKELGYYKNDTQSKESPRRIRLTGKVHLFRSTKKIDDEKYKAPEENLALLLDVPDVLDDIGFSKFCTEKCKNVSDLYFIRDGNKNYYSVVAKLPTAKDAETFFNQMQYGLYHSELRFGPVYFLHKVEYMNISSIASVPWRGYRQLPSCHLCLELLNADASGLVNPPPCSHLVGGKSKCKCNFSMCLSCKVWNPHKEPNADIRCSTCKDPANWLCFICGSVFCGSMQAGHAFDHHCRAHHTYVFEISTRIIYDYLENSRVRDRALLRGSDLRTAESSLQRNLDAMDVEADKKVATAELVHDDISPEAKEDENEDVLRNNAIPKTKITDFPAPPICISVSTSERNPGSEEDIRAHEDDDAQRKAQEQDLILTVATAFKREYYHYLPQRVACDKEIFCWKNIEIELARVKKQKLLQELKDMGEKVAKLVKKKEELQSKKRR